QINMTQAVVRFVLNEHQLLRLTDFARLRLLMKLQKAHRHAVGIRIVLRLDIHPLFSELCSPRCIRQAARHVTARFEECRHWRSFSVEPGRLQSPLHPKAPPGPLPSPPPPRPAPLRAPPP